jgi:hypothetical protein
MDRLLLMSNFHIQNEHKESLNVIFTPSFKIIMSHAACKQI